MHKQDVQGHTGCEGRPGGAALAAQAEAIVQKKEEVRRKLRERRVPSSPFGRVMGFAQLGASLVYGTMSDSVSQYFAPKGAEQDAQKPANRWATPPLSCIEEGHLWVVTGPCGIRKLSATLLLAVEEMHTHTSS